MRFLGLHTGALYAFGPWALGNSVIVMGPKMPQVLEFVFDDLLNTVYVFVSFVLLTILDLYIYIYKDWLNKNEINNINT